MSQKYHADFDNLLPQDPTGIVLDKQPLEVHQGHDENSERSATDFRSQAKDDLMRIMPPEYGEGLSELLLNVLGPDAVKSCTQTFGETTKLFSQMGNIGSHR